MGRIHYSGGLDTDVYRWKRWSQPENCHVMKLPFSEPLEVQDKGVQQLFLDGWMTLVCEYGGQEQLIGSVLGLLSCLTQCCRFDPPLGRIFLVEGIFPLELTRALTPFPQNSFWWEYKPRSRLCTHAFHHTDSTDPDIHVLDGWMPATKTHPTCTIHKDRMWLPQWLDWKTVT